MLKWAVTANLNTLVCSMTIKIRHFWGTSSVHFDLLYNCQIPYNDILSFRLESDSFLMFIGLPGYDGFRLPDTILTFLIFGHLCNHVLVH